MGWRFRKSQNFGPMRVNFSKSGIGYSFGGKVFRVTRTASGNVRKTVTIPGTGISYSQNAKTSKAETGSLQIGGSLSPSEEIAKAVAVRVRTFFVCMWCGLIMTFATAFWIPSFFIAVIFYIAAIVAYFVRIRIDYDDLSWADDINLPDLLQSSRVWVQTSSSHELAKVACKAKFPLSSNAQAFTIVRKNQRLIFLPDRVFAINGLKVAMVRYEDATLSAHPIKWKENARVAKDTEVMYTAWQHENKDGTQDRRFSQNRKVPVCRYTSVHISDSEYFDVTLLCSRASQ